ncbi:MAG: hypothetical protein IPO05_14765 [Flavobacteriales bacterium]|nr:hypothetical protein [Flavobacteriales bacterium]
MHCARPVLALFTLLALGTAQSQTFMRAYAVPAVSFSPPQGQLFSFGAVVLDEGYLFTTLDGLACSTDGSGELIPVCPTQTSTGSIPSQLQLRSVERAADGGFYFQALQGADTALLLRPTPLPEVLWQKGTTFSNVALNEQGRIAGRWRLHHGACTAARTIHTPGVEQLRHQWLRQLATHLPCRSLHAWQHELPRCGPTP